MCDLNQLNSARERLVNPSAASALLLSDAHAQRDCSSRSHLFTEFIEFATRKDIMPIDFNRAWAGERGSVRHAVRYGLHWVGWIGKPFSVHTL